MKNLLTLIVAAIATGVISLAPAQNFPDKAMRIIVPFPPGGGTDTFSRIVGAKMGELLGQQIVIENRPGAQGNIGTAAGAKSPPDGYTLTYANNGTVAVNPHLYPNPGFDPLRDFAAVARGTDEVWAIVVHPSVPAKTAKDLAALSKRNRGTLSYASGGVVGQMVAELFKLTTGADILHIPYKGTGTGIGDVISGNVSMIFTTPAGPLPFIKSGRLRALLILGHKRLEILPDVPTAKEIGYPDLDLPGWYGLLVPAQTPQDIVRKLNAAMVRALNSPDVLERMRAVGQIPAPSTPEEFAEQIKSDYARWGKIVKATNVKVE